MTRFQPKNPDYRAVAIHTFEQQRAMRTLGISIARLEPGEVDLAMDYSLDLTQQHGSSMPGSSPQVSTVPAALPPSH
jgi:acyl-coenzyme A thioesterase PaaI-like protein